MHFMCVSSAMCFNKNSHPLKCSLKPYGKSLTTNVSATTAMPGLVRTFAQLPLQEAACGMLRCAGGRLVFPDIGLLQLLQAHCCLRACQRFRATQPPQTVTQGNACPP